MVPEAPTRLWRSDREIALRAQLGVFRRGSGDPTSRFGRDGTVTRAAQTPDGVGTLHLVCRPGDSEVQAQAWGPGAAWLLDAVPGLLGDDDDPSGFEPHHDLVAEAWRRFSHWRVPRSGLVFDALAPAVIEQKVTGQEAFSGYRVLVRRFGEPAPGPFPGLMAPPTAAGWAAVHTPTPGRARRRRCASATDTDAPCSSRPAYPAARTTVRERAPSTDACSHAQDGIAAHPAAVGGAISPGNGPGAGAPKRRTSTR